VSRQTRNPGRDRPLGTTARSHVSYETLRNHIAQGSRAPWQEALAQALLGMPQAADWQELAQRAPHLWSAGVARLAEPAGYAPQSVHVDVRADAGRVAGELVRRYGVERARVLLEQAGLPGALALVHAPEPAAIDASEAGE